MNVAFAADALDDARAFRHLTAIWWLFVDERHRWLVEDDQRVKASPWFTAEGARVRSAICDQLRKAGRGAATGVAVVVRRQDETATWRDGAWHLPAHLAVRWLSEPAILLVENARIDGAFLRLVALHVGEKALRRRLGSEGFTRLTADWTGPLGDGQLFQVRHGGGSDTATQLELLVEGSPRPRPRLLVVLDSDRRAAGAAHGKTAGQVVEKAGNLPRCESGRQIEPIILDKHEVENYLPHEAIWRVFRKADISDPDFGDLKQIFGADLARRVLFDEAAQRDLHASALRARAGEGGRELDRIVQRLCDLL